MAEADATAPSVTGIPLEARAAPEAPKSRLGEGTEDDTQALISALGPLKHDRVATLQSTHGMPQRRGSARSRVIGKRKQRRRDNSNLSSLSEDVAQDTFSNEHLPREEDIEIKKATFPVPPPASFARKAPPASAKRPTPDPQSARMGRYVLSMRGIQKRLRSVLKTDSRTADLVRLVEKEIIDWIYKVQVYEGPHDLQQQQQPRVLDAHLPREEVTDEPSILEHERSAVRIKWEVQEPFVRFLVHLVARLWEVASFSRTEADGRRMTTLLRPNTMHADPLQARGASGAMETPPTTEWEASSMAGSMIHTSDSEFTDFAADSDLDGEVPGAPPSSSSLPASPWQMVSPPAAPSSRIHDAGATSTDDEAHEEGDVTVQPDPVSRVISVSSSEAGSEFGDDEDNLAESTGKLNL